MDARARAAVPPTTRTPIFGAAARSVVPLDLAAHGYVEEEHILTGSAHRYADGLVVEGGPYPYATRVLVRRPIEADPGVTYVSILNASQGYDIEDDWRRAWDWLITHRHTYVAVTLKPLSVEALRTFSPTRYGTLSWQVDRAPHRPPVAAGPGWDPFQVVAGAEEGLAWDILVDLGAVVRDPGLLPGGSRRVFLMGQSQSGAYVNTFAAHVHPRRRRTDGGPLYDGYLAGVASIMTRPLQQGTGGVTTWQVGPAPDIDVPVIKVTSRYGDLATYLAACQSVDDAWEAAGYLEPVGRRLLERVAEELWNRVTTGAQALWSTPQSVQ